MATLGGQVTVLNDINSRQKTKIASLGYSCNNLTDAAYFIETLSAVTLKTASGSMGSLNDNAWAYIDWASRSGIADTLWSVGDRKGVYLSGQTGEGSYSVTFASTYYAYIVGFNHNATVEGDNKIHFEFGFDALSGGNHIAFVDPLYKVHFGSYYDYPDQYRMNATATNAGGWASSLMRTGTLHEGTNHSFYGLLPPDLQAVIKSITKYTDNVGNASGHVAGNVTATTDKLFLMAAFELRGSVGTANTNESSHLKQYQYYINGNSKLRVKHNDTAAGALFLLRSPSAADQNFCGYNVTDGGMYCSADTGYGISPCFCV